MPWELLTVGDGGTSGSLGTGAVVNNGVLVFNRSDAVVFNTAVSGTGALVKNGSGTLTIQKQLSYTGGTHGERRYGWFCPREEPTVLSREICLFRKGHR